MDYAATKNYIFERLRTELPDNLFYHGVHHTCSVEDSVKQIARHEGIESDQLTILKTAALCHDFGFIIRYRDNESIACDEARKILPQFSYTTDDIEIICGLITATKVPQSPNTRLEKILCDADLYYLGTDKFDEVSKTLRAELEAAGCHFSDEQWIQFQLNFMESHNYFTKYGQDNLERTKQKHIAKLREQLNKCK